MKKVLALVLAVIMVCTMAMAISVSDGGKPAVTPSGAPYAQITPGTVLYFTIKDLAGSHVKPYYDADTNEFVPEKNAVGVVYGKGAELVASQGWVRITKKAPTVTTTSEEASWQYQIVLKDSDTAIFDGKSLDFSITGVSFKPYGDGKVEYSVDATDATLKLDKFERDYGWTTANLSLDASGKKDITTGFNKILNPCYVITTLTGTYDGKGEAVNANVWFMKGSDNTRVDFSVKAGQKLLRKDYDFTSDEQTVLNTKYGIDTATILGATPTGNYKHIIVNDTNLVGTANITHWTNKMNVYSLAMDGTLSKVVVTVNDGVATATVPAYSATFVYDGTLANVSATVGAAPAGSPGTTTNPGTGANDVVGVAAALAVVALVSGAAISLKK